MIVDKDIMTEKTRQFYKTLQIDIPDEYIELAVMSLTMPQYAKEFKDKYHEKIGDHRALATVGDAVCGAFLMLDRYEKSKTKKDLTAEKKSCYKREFKSHRQKNVGRLVVCKQQ